MGVHYSTWVSLHSALCRLSVDSTAQGVTTLVLLLEINIWFWKSSHVFLERFRIPQILLKILSMHFFGTVFMRNRASSLPNLTVNLEITRSGELKKPCARSPALELWSICLTHVTLPRHACMCRWAWANAEGRSKESDAFLGRWTRQVRGNMGHPTSDGEAFVEEGMSHNHRSCATVVSRLLFGFAHAIVRWVFWQMNTFTSFLSCQTGFTCMAYENSDVY